MRVLRAARIKLAWALLATSLICSVARYFEPSNQEHPDLGAAHLRALGSRQVCQRLQHVSSALVGKGSMKHVRRGTVDGFAVAVVQYAGKHRGLYNNQSRHQMARRDYERLFAWRGTGHMVQVYGLCEQAAAATIVQEWLPLGSLKALKGVLGPSQHDWAVHLGLAQQLAAIVAALHVQQLSCEDLVPGQFMLARTRATGPGLSLKMVDIDSLKPVPSSGQFPCLCWAALRTAQGGPRCRYVRRGHRNRHCLAWRSPESLRCAPSCTLKSDVFSLGMVLWAIMPHTGLPFGEWPYGVPEGSEQAWRDRVIHSAGKVLPTLPPDCPAAYRLLLQRMWSNSPGDRPSAHEVAEILGLMLESPLKSNM
eukprot:TRINITY_DN16916_c0_g1_i2.p1 TRINITY_DN16916_c0_g1~~TRINITY_DN16916_c0_g1_i2.p1  ORF type:complete len:365 (+),score=63.70 TRINITY_DN16916_c0_g1_i2:156-1250(+)